MGDVIERAEKALDELSTYDAAPLWPIVAELVAELKDARAENDLFIGTLQHVHDELLDMWPDLERLCGESGQ